MSKKIFSVKVAFVLCLVFTLTTGYSSSAEKASSDKKTDPIVIKAGHVVDVKSAYHMGLVKLNELLQERLNGRYVLKIHPNSQLGGERDLVEGVSLGSINMAVSAGAVVANFVPSLDAAEVPYLIRSVKHADRVFLGDIGKQLMADIDAKGMKCLAIWESGFRNVSNNLRPINSVNDFKGMKIRTMETRMHQDLFRALDSVVVAMSWSEAYSALQQRAIDGVEPPTLLTYTLKVQEVCKNFAVTEHIYTSSPVLLSIKIWNSLSSEDQKIFMECAYDAGIYEREYNRKVEKECEENLAKAGVKITHPDKGPIIKKIEPLYKNYEAKYGDFINKVLAMDK
jgi:TRAP-type transport system periplasmic protein